ncbi:MAG: 50S ribosomal protein L17 [Candidatus Niyogibacteria bacterium]|nr:50S ribosomal protein L17 [Candidatus Niyogibacteria bacterium]
MRHLRKGKKFSRVRKTRKALMKAVLRSFVERGRIETTLPKAKEVGRLAEKLVTKAKKGGLEKRREIMVWLNPVQTAKIFKVAGDFKNRRGGYTRITRTRRREHDRAEMAVLEFVK